MDPKALILLINTFANLALGIIVWLRNRKSERHIVFIVFASSIALWSFGLAMFYFTPDKDIALLWAKILYFAGSMVGVSLCYFSFIFPTYLLPTQLKRIRFILIVPSIFVFVITLTTNYVLNGIIAEQYKGLTYGIGYVIWFIHFTFFMFLSFINLFTHLRKSVGIQRLQVKYILIGTLSAALFTAITNLILPTIGNFRFFNIGPIMTISMAGFIAYAIIKHRFMDIRLIIARTVSFTLLILFVTFVYSFLLVFLLSLFTGLNLDNRALAISAVLVLIMAFTVQYLRRGIEKITDSIFYKDRYDTGKLLYSLALKMASIIEIEELLHQLLHMVLSEVRVSRGVFILIKDHKINQVAHEGYTIAPEFDEQKILVFLDENKTLIFEELPEGQLRELMRGLDFTIIIPLRIKNEIIGLLVFGEKLSGDVYASSDIQVLETFAPEAAVAIENARAYEEIRRFNVTLRDEVDRATKELQQKNEQLKELDRLKDDFVSVASHELRTPMTAIKSYLWMALAGQGGPLNEKQMYYIQRGYSSVDRLIKLVNDMLNISRIDSGRLTIQVQSVNIVQLVREIVEEVIPRATELGVSVVIEEQGAIPEVLADPDKIKEVVYNLIGNSMKFTSSGGKISVSFVQKENIIEITVKDTGAGIASEDLSKLFQKFGILPGSYVTNQPTLGTGLGLYICKSLIELHGGKVWAVSEGKGKGATFTFSLKVFNQEDLNKFNEKYGQQSQTNVGLIHTKFV
jgi:signal transduction histidine kinase